MGNVSSIVSGYTRLDKAKCMFEATENDGLYTKLSKW